MFVSDWMTRKVYTIEPGASVSDAARILKEQNVKHLPVLKGGSVKGIISDRDIKEYVSSKASSLDVYELHYLLQKTKVKDIMKTKVSVTTPDTPVEEASMVMHDENIGCLPVVKDRKLVGIISDRDIFEVLVDITGVRHGGHRIFMTVKDTSGSIKDVADIIRKHGFALQGLLTSYEGVKKGMRNIVAGTKGAGDFRGLRAEFEGTYAGVRIQKG
jgi:acetoin utilization protein AcuB